jgi:3-oxoacyl-[acyl-carrier-protein] synthase-3
MNNAEPNSTGLIRPVSVIGTGSYLPERILTNAEIEKIVDTTDEWIVTRSGIRERRIARDDQATSDLAAEAGRRALEAAGVAAEELDQIIVGTITQDMGFPSTACFVQHQLKACNAHCFDVAAACSGFVFALETGRQFVATGSVRTSLVIGAEKLSVVTDWTDRTTCVLFGDGAGAAVIRSVEGRRGILGTVMGSDGSLSDLLKIPGGGSRYPASAKTLEERMHYMKMTGKEVFKHAVRTMADATLQVLKKCNLSFDDIQLVIPHQANIRIIQAIGDRLGLPVEKVFVNVEKYGNMSSATVPVALDQAIRSGRVKPGDRVVLVAFGGGFTWGAMVLEI